MIKDSDGSSSKITTVDVHHGAELWRIPVDQSLCLKVPILESINISKMSSGFNCHHLVKRQ